MRRRRAAAPLPDKVPEGLVPPSFSAFGVGRRCSGNISLMLTSISTPWFVRFRNDGNVLAARRRSQQCGHRAYLRGNCCRSFSRVRPEDSVRAVLPSITTPPAAAVGSGRGGGGARAAEYRASVLPHSTQPCRRRLPARERCRSRFDQIAHHRFNVAHIADFGELRSLHFQEWRIRELREAPRTSVLPTRWGS